MTITLTKELPTEEGCYFWCKSKDSELVEVVVVLNNVSLVAIRGVTTFASFAGGYWAKVEKEHFIFEGDDE